MFHSIMSYVSTHLLSYGPLSAVGVSLVLSLEALAHLKANQIIGKTELTASKGPTLPMWIVLAKHCQLCPMTPNIPPLNKKTPWVTLTILSGLAVALLSWAESHDSKISQNQSYHRIVSGIGFVSDVAVKAANIFAVSVLLRKYSQCAMVTVGVAMTIFSSICLWYDWKNDHYFLKKNNR